MHDIQIEMLIERIQLYVRSTLSSSLYSHSCRVAAYGEQLAVWYGCTRRQQRICYLAGIAHDMCKELPVSVMQRIVVRQGMPVNLLEWNNPNFLHGMAAAVVLRENFGIHHKPLLRSVYFHTLASTKFDAVGKIVYISDKIEPGRKNREKIRMQTKVLSLDALFICVLHESMSFVAKKGLIVHPYTKKVCRFMQKRVCGSID